MEVMQVLHMNIGSGENTYAKNSTLQSEIIAVGKPIIKEAILEILSNNVVESMEIADLGCLSGPNTLALISDVIDMVQATSRLQGRTRLELRVFLNDLYSNDYNDIFMSLPAFYKRLKEEKCTGIGSCFIAAVPGSFYGRLFPSNSMHFVHSSSSLHWLSQVPVDLESNTSRHLNKGKIYISKSSPRSVLDAYSLQFQNDFSQFIKSRSKELIPGGRMVLSFMGRRSADPTTEDSCDQWEQLA